MIYSSDVDSGEKLPNQENGIYKILLIRLLWPQLAESSSNFLQIVTDIGNTYLYNSARHFDIETGIPCGSSALNLSNQ